MVNSKFRFEARATAAQGVGELLLYGDIGPSDYGMIDEKSFAALLKELGDVKVINLRMNSAGGSAFAGLAIYNQLKRHPARVEVDVDGLAASIASVIAMAGDVVRMGEGAQLMIHDASVFAWGNAADLRRNADILDSISGDLAEIYARRAGRPADEFRDLMRAETWFGAEAAVEAKLADSVTAGAEVDAHLEPEIAARFKHPPKQLLSPRASMDVARARVQVPRLRERVAILNCKEPE